MRVMVLHVDAKDDQKLFEQLKVHLSIMKLKNIYFEYVDVKATPITTDQFKGYDLVVVYITPTFLASSEDWQDLAGYLEHSRVPNIPFFIRKCSLDGTIFAARIRPSTKALSEVQDIDNMCVTFAEMIDRALESTPAVMPSKSSKPTPDVAVFANKADVKLMQEMIAHLEIAFAGLHIWTSWNIEAGANREEEKLRGRSAKLQIIGLSPQALTENTELVRAIKDDHQRHDCLAFMIKLRPAPFVLAFEPRELRLLLPEGSTMSQMQTATRGEKWVEIVQMILGESKKPRMSSTELTRSYYDE